MVVSERQQRPHHQATSRRQLGQRVRFGFGRPYLMKLATSPSYDNETRHSLLGWKANEESFLLVLVPALEDSWIILCDHDKVLHHLFGAELAFVSCRALTPSCGVPILATLNPKTPPF